MNPNGEELQIRSRPTKLGATPKLDPTEWPILVKMIQSRIRLEQEAPPGEYVRMITEVWNILLKDLPSGSKETRRRLKKHANNLNFIVRDDGKEGDFPHGPQIFLVTQTVNENNEVTSYEKLFVPPWHVDKVLNANHPYNQTHINNRHMHTGGEALFALISEQYYGVSRKKCQQWVNECPICIENKQQASLLPPPPSPIKSKMGDEMNFPLGVDIDSVPTLDYDIDPNKMGVMTTGKRMSMDNEMKSPPPKRLKSGAKTQYVVSVDKADRRIRPYVIETPLYRSDFYSNKLNANIFFKCEYCQVSGSFKSRGVFNKVIKEKDRFKKGGLPVFITASDGNHAIAVIKALNTFGIAGEVLLPSSINQLKLDYIKSLVVPIYGERILLRYCGDTLLEAETEAEKESHLRNLIFIPSYNDSDIINGHATIAPEILRQLKRVNLKRIDYIIVPVGRGALASSISAYFKDMAHHTMENPIIVGVSPENDCQMLDSINAGQIVSTESKPTISESTCGGILPNSPTFEMCKNYIDEWVKVSEDDIEYVVWEMLQHQHTIIEGAAALAIAALYKEKEKYAGKNVIAILTGGNLGVANINHIIQKFTST